MRESKQIIQLLHARVLLHPLPEFILGNDDASADFQRREALCSNQLVCSGTGPCRQGHVLRDRTGAAFPLLPAYGHRTEVQNSRVLWLADRPDHQRLGLRFARLRFTTETAEECVRVFRGYLKGEKAPGEFTRGLYERGVE